MFQGTTIIKDCYSTLKSIIFSQEIFGLGNTAAAYSSTACYGGPCMHIPS